MIALLLASAAAVALYVLSFAPADLGPLAFFALAPWCWLARRLRGGRLFVAGTVVGAAILAIGCSWIAQTATVNLWLMVVPESLAFGLFALLLRWTHVRNGWPAIVALPAAFTTVEVVRGRWPLDGFPWLTLGYSQHAWLDVVQLAALGGVHAVTFLLALTSGAVVDAVAAQRARAGTRSVVAPLAIAAIVVAAVAIGGRLALGDASKLDQLELGPRMLLVQPNVPQRLKESAKEHPGERDLDWHEVLERHRELVTKALTAESEPVDLLVWSETMLPVPLPAPGATHVDEAPGLARFRREQEQELRDLWFARRHRPLLAGAVTYDGDFQDDFAPSWNSAQLYDGDGRLVATYDKKVPVPGGEYLPWVDHFSDSVRDAIKRRVHDLAGFLPKLRPGTRSGVLPVATAKGTLPAGLTICFEFAYPHLGRELVREGARVLVNLSNEAWFPDTAEFAQSTAMSVFRAAETRRSLVRCANSGTSGLIDPWGRTVDANGRSTLLEKEGRRDGFEGTIVTTPRLCDVTTPYVRWGEWIGWTAAALLAALAIGRRGRAT